MNKELEDMLENLIRSGLRPREAIQMMLDGGFIQSWKQPLWTLEKWTRKGKWNYGVSIVGGWFEDETSK